MSDAVAKAQALHAFIRLMASLCIDVLDKVEGDPDLEDSDDDQQVDDDRCDERDSGDDEPSLGRLESAVFQGPNSCGATDDLEHDEAELGEPENEV